MLWTVSNLVLSCYLPTCVNGHPPLTTRLDLINRGARIPLTVRRSILLPNKDFLSMLIKDDAKDQDIASDYRKNEDSLIPKRKSSVVFNQRKRIFEIDSPIYPAQKRRNSFSYKYQTNFNRMERYKNVIRKDNELVTDGVICDSDKNVIKTESTTESISDSTKDDNQIVSSNFLSNFFNGRTSPEVPTTTVTPDETTENEVLTTIFQKWEPEPDKVISVRVSSSVGTTSKITNPNVTLVTETRPVPSSLQTSPFGIEESIPEISPVKYHSSVSSSATGHSVRLYSSFNNITNLEPQNRTESITFPTNSSEEDKYEVETRVETVSYHQEVILNQNRPKIENLENSTQEVQKQNVSHYLHLPKNYQEPEKVYGLPEENYEIEESVSVVSNGRVHGVQGPSATESPDKDNNKFGYIVEGRDFRKYRIEERTPDGFIVGEYGVFKHDDGSLRGVRYTADSTTNPRLIYDALVKFLSL